MFFLAKTSEEELGEVTCAPRDDELTGLDVDLLGRVPPSRADLTLSLAVTALMGLP